MGNRKVDCRFWRCCGGAAPCRGRVARVDSVSNQAPVFSLTEVRRQKSVPGSGARPAAKAPRCEVHSRIKGCGGAKCFPQQARKDTGKRRGQPTHEVEEAVRGPAKVVRRRIGDHRVEPGWLKSEVRHRTLCKVSVECNLPTRTSPHLIACRSKPCWRPSSVAGRSPSN